MKYAIEHPPPEKENGKLSLLLKYITLFIVGWFVGRIILLWKLGDITRRFSANADQVLDNPGIISAVIALLVVFVLGRRFTYKFSRGSLVSVELGTDSVTPGMANSYNGAYRQQVISANRFRVSIEKAEDELFGKQRIISFFDKYQLITTVNVELSAWCRHPEIEEMIEELEKFRR